MGGGNPAALIPSPQTSSPAPPPKRSPPLIQSWFESISCLNLTEKVLRIWCIPFVGKWMQPEIVLLEKKTYAKGKCFVLSIIRRVYNNIICVHIHRWMFMCAGACVGHKITNRVTKLRKTSKGGGRKKMTEYRTPCDLKVGGARRIWGKGSQPVRRKDWPCGRKERRVKA